MTGTPANSGPDGRIFIAGGTGFVGTHLRGRLGNRPMRLLVRQPDGFPDLKSAEIEVVKGNLDDPASLRGKLDGCTTVVNLVAIIAENGQETFDSNIRQGTENLVAEAKRAGVRHFVQMSAMGAANNDAYPYLHAKWAAEQAVKNSGLEWTILRPSVIFGPGDEFVTTLAKLIGSAPVIPVVGAGKSKFQPVSVKDVADSFVRAIDDPTVRNTIHELGGPDILEYEQLLDVIATKLGKQKRKVHVPIGVMKQVVALSSPLPAAVRPPVTKEQLKMLSLDNCSADSATERLIGKPPTRLADGIDYIVSA